MMTGRRYRFIFTLSRKRTHAICALLLLFLSCDKDDAPSSDENPDTGIEQPGDNNPNDTTGDFTILFSEAYGGSQDDTFHQVITTTDGGFAALGYSQSVDGDITDNSEQVNMYWLVKTTANGALQWSKTYGGSDDDRGEHLIQTTDGGFAISGYSKSNDGDVSENNGFYDHWIVKLDSSGNIQWEKSYGFLGSDQVFSIIQTADGGYFTAGFLDVTASGGDGNDGFTDNDNQNTRAVEHGVGEFWGHKLNANGELEWRRYFGGSNNDRAYTVTQANDGGILLVGASESNDFDISNSKGSYDFWAVRIDTDGNLVWEKSFGGSEIEIAYAVTKTSDGGYILAGDTRSNDGDVTNFKGSADIWLVKIDDQGTLLWQKTLGGSNFETARAIQPISGGYAIAGASRSLDGDVDENNGQNDFWILTINENGTLQKQQSFGGNNQEFGYGIAITDQDEIIFCGDTQSTTGLITSANGASDAVLIKLQ